jgi:dolichyl-phosphate-mannose--protein O-mannosyl transferase
MLFVAQTSVSVCYTCVYVVTLALRRMTDLSYHPMLSFQASSCFCLENDFVRMSAFCSFDGMDCMLIFPGSNWS